MNTQPTQLGASVSQCISHYPQSKQGGAIQSIAYEVWAGDHCIQDCEVQNDLFAGLHLDAPGLLHNAGRAEADGQ
jgi:hypothetical protein